MNIEKGIRQNLVTFIILVCINVFVGSMVGLERTVLPILAKEEFGIASVTATLSFIVSFGVTKALMNLLAGHLADRFGRKSLLIVGWFIAGCVPLLIIFAQSWWIIIAANVLLGLSQGLTWSMTVNMKIDLAKDNQKGIAVGLNEFAGYVGLSLTALLSGYVMTRYSARPEPFLIGFFIVFLGLTLSAMVKDHQHKDKKMKRSTPTFRSVFVKTSFQDSNLSTTSLIGLTTNFKDGVAWGLFPLFFATTSLSGSQMSLVIALYPASWGIFQLVTGPLSDKWGRKWLILSGVMLQLIGLLSILFGTMFYTWLMASLLLGIGTALVYPTLIASISDVASSSWRATSLGVYRFWRDSGYAFGALAGGVVADQFGIENALLFTVCFIGLTLLIALFRLTETNIKNDA
ncbi:MFS transporter [Pontibacillus salipaludis]|uniref:MFS transporter n=1 Tax=Pontibacillus salipaludis TaxID=1697394 RepID=A0ABQ1PK22_9BACI|nr:MFS transporter [Pontibacillus salipaludis]GGC98596.1 MFS transporter [Pontibacillus salipaludis]